MSRFGIVLTLVVGLAWSGYAFAVPVAPYQEVRAEYNPANGNLQVSVNSVLNWYIEWLGGEAMTGYEPYGLPAGGGLFTNHDLRIGESNFTPMTYDLNLGNAAATGLPDDNSLKLYWNSSLGSPLYTSNVDFGSGLPTNIPPAADINGPFSIEIATDPLDITLDASGSFDPDGDILSYMWDLDDDGTFEVDTGLIPTLDIANVITTFGSPGSHPVAVEVFDGISTDIASTNVSLIAPPPSTDGVNAWYDPATGHIVVSVDGVTGWFVEGYPGNMQVMTGDEPVGLPSASGLVTNNDQRIGEAFFYSFSYSVDLGNVAQTGLQPGEVKIYWYEGLGTPLLSKEAIVGKIPEPTSLVLFGMGLLGLACCQGRYGRC